MAEAIQKQTSVALTFEKRPEEFLTQLEAFLITIQDAYRSKLSEPEQQLWVRGLCQGQERFSMQEIVTALDEMIRNPPLHEVPGPDGPVSQKWYGMPKLPDLIETMLSLRTKRAREDKQLQDEQQQEERRKLEKRRAEHPEEFFGLADVLKMAEKILPEIAVSTDKDGIQAPAICILPPEPVSAVLMSDEAALRRVQQMKADFEMHQQQKVGKQ